MDFNSFKNNDSSGSNRGGRGRGWRGGGGRGGGYNKWNNNGNKPWFNKRKWNNWNKNKNQSGPTNEQNSNQHDNFDDDSGYISLPSNKSIFS